MRIGVIGLNHKIADIKLRELLAKACQRRFNAGHSLHGRHHCLLLSTCNRTEIYFFSEELANAHTYLLNILRQEVNEEFDQKLYSYFGDDCFIHLARVTAGLDSAVVAETEIQGQVKKAYEAAAIYGLPQELHYLLQKALKIAKKVRSDLPLQPGLPGIEHAVLNTGLNFFKDSTPSLLLVGASEINLKILSFLKTKKIENISICNRSLAKAQNTATLHDVKLICWEDLHQWHHFDWVIFGTKAPEPLITIESAPTNLLSQKLIIDLSVPRNVDPHLSQHRYITLVNIDQLNYSLHMRKQKILKTIGQAEGLIIQASRQQVRLFVQKEKLREKLLAAGA